MKFLASILENEKSSNTKASKELAWQHLQNLCASYPNEVRTVLHKTGIPVSSTMPPHLLSFIIVKHLDKNADLRTAMAQMLLENDSYASADGTKWQLIGGAVTAVGSVLAGLGRSQTQKEETQSSSAQLEAEHKKELEAQRLKNKRNTIIVISISALVIIALVFAFRAAKAPKKLLTQSIAK
jgi:hypothetical protein